MTRGQRKTAQKKTTNFVICHPVSSTSSVLPLPLHFGRRRFFGDSFLCVFPQRRLVNVANFRRGGERASTLLFLFSASTLLSRTFESHPKGSSAPFALRERDSSVKYFGSVNRWKVHPFLPYRKGICHFLSVFPRVESFRGLNRETPWPSSMKETRAKLTLGNE